MRRTLSLIIGCAALLALSLPSLAAARGRDGNHDRIPDRWERAHHLSLSVKQTNRDQDRDGLKNLAEYRDRTDPRDADTDNDGLRDGSEAASGNDPRDADTDDDAVRDGAENAGAVVSLEGTKLTLRLANGDTVVGSVTAGTEVSCRAPRAPAQTARRGSDDASGDDSSSGPSTGAGTPTTGDDDEPGDERDGEPEDDQHGDDAAEHPEQHNEQRNCPAGALKAGAVVHEARLKTTSTGLVFDEIELFLP